MRIGPNKVKKESYSPQIGGDMISHHHMVSPQNGDTWDGLPSPLAMPLFGEVIFIRTAFFHFCTHLYINLYDVA